MCLIIYSPAATVPPRKYFTEAAANNPDGIGIMSADGVVKFVGKRKTRRAWSYLQQIAADGIPYAVHFRWATHGRINRDNTHPFEIPGTPGAYLMHNGILWTSTLSTDAKSDTRIFADEIMPGYMTMAERGAQDYLTALGAEAAGNRLLIMRPDGRTFDIVNRHLWTEHDGILYSNTYSIDSMPTTQRTYSDWQNRSKTYQESKANWLVPALYRGRDSYVSHPSGPTLEADECSTWEDDMESATWEEDYEKALAVNMTRREAAEYADAMADSREAARDCADERPASGGAYAEARRRGFDWQDSSSWHLYPSQRATREDDRDGVALYV